VGIAMNNQAKTKQQLINELADARGKCAELEGKLEALGQMQEVLRKTEERLELALDGAEIGLWDYNLQTGEAFVSPQRAAMVGYSVEELEPHFSSWGKLVHPEDIARVTDAFNAHVQGRTPLYQCEHRLRTKPGEYIWILARAKVVEWDKDGGPLRIVGTSLDISDRKQADESLQKAYGDLEYRVSERTAELLSANQRLEKEIVERKQMEAALRESEKRYRELVENANDIIYLTDADGYFILFNAVGLKITGYSQEEIVRKHYLDMIHPDYRKEVERFYGLQFVKRIPDTYHEVPIVTHEGKTVWIGQNVQLIMEGDTIAGFQAICRDITDRKRAEEELRESEERLELALMGADLGSWDWNLKTGRAVWNARASRMLGYSPGEVETNLRTWKSLVHPEDWPRVSEVLNSHLEGRVSFIELEYRVRCKSGDWKWILSRGKIVAYDTDGTPLRITGTTLDITDRKQMEQALRESEERYRAIFNNAAVGISVSDRETRFLEVNSRSASMLGYTQEELKALSAFDITHPDDRQLSIANFASLAGGKVASYRMQKRYIRKDGEVVWGDVHVSAIYNERGEFMANLGVIVDITDRKRAEEERERMRAQLLHARKMEAIGTLTGGIAHEFNNLLTIVSGYGELLLAEKNESDPGFSDLQRIVQAAQRGAELVISLLAFSRKSEMKVTHVSLNEEVRQVRKLLDRTLPKMIEIETKLNDRLDTVEADSGQIRQILMNLALNARDAMPKGGKLSIRTNNVDAEQLPEPLAAEPRDYVQLTVSDTGIGMDTDTLDRIFEPFYTTKGRAYKTGLGLAVVHGIIEQHRGFVSCESKPGEGTTFNIYFPAVEPRRSVGTTVKTRLLGGTETVLLVDDEEYVRDLASRFLEHAGYSVIAAADARMALDLYRKKRSNISLVILDLIMPKIGGMQCLEELLKIEPSLKVLIASGYSDADNKEELIQAGAKGFVEKPFQIAELLQALRDALDTD
jgi:two-component system cell cycle sensor histidine kinase/response regulator CckA